MASITHILDTSAILAHYFDEPGGTEVDALWQNPDNRLAICVLSIPELKTRLRAEVDDEVEIERAFDLYVNQLTIAVPVDRGVACAAVSLRESMPSRLPLFNACIAGCAGRHDCLLVHRDPHMDPLSAALVRRMRLPDR